MKENVVFYELWKKIRQNRTDLKKIQNYNQISKYLKKKHQLRLPRATGLTSPMSGDKPTWPPSATDHIFLNKLKFPN